MIRNGISTLSFNLPLWTALFVVAHLPSSSPLCTHPVSSCMPHWNCLRRDSSGCPYCAPECRLDKAGCPLPVACLRMLGCTEEVNGCVVCTEACTVRSQGRRYERKFDDFVMPPDQDNRPGKQDSHQKQKRPSSFLVLSPKADASFGRIGVASQWKNHMAATSKPVALPSANDSINDV